MASQAEIDLIVNASNTLPQITRDLDRIVRVAEDGAETIDLDVALNTQAALNTVSSDLDRVVAAVANGADDIDVNAVLETERVIARLQRDLATVIATAQSGADQDPLDIDAVLDSARSLPAIRSDLDEMIADIQRTADDIDIDVDVDTTDATRQARTLAPELGRLGGIARDAGGSVASLGASIGSAGIAAGAAIPIAAGLAAAIQNILPAAAVATQGMLAMQLVSGTLKLGLMGVEEALDTAFDPEATPEELAEAMSKLAPEAKKFVLELRSMRGGFRDLQLDVQNRLFADLAGGIRPLADAVLPSVSDALGRTADSLNRMAKEAGVAAIELGANGTLDKALQGATKGLENLEEVPGRVVTGFGQLAAAAAPAFDRITAAADRASADIADKLTAAFESGELETAIDEAIDLIKQLGESGGDILGGLRNIFGGLTTDGRDLFTILNDLTGAFEELTASEAFQTILNELVMTADTLVENVLPLLLEAFEQLGPVIEELGPPIRDLLNELGESLMPVIEELGPILLDLAIIFKEQMPTAINALKIALGLLTAVLRTVHNVLEEFVIPILSEVAEVVNNRFVQAIANAAQDIPGATSRILQAFVELRTSVTEQLRRIGENLSTLAANVRERFAGAIRHTIQTVVGYFSDLPGRIRNALGNLGGLLVNAGADIVRGLINGMLGQIGSLISAASRIASTVKNSIAGALDINSPSVVMKGLGEDTMEGYINGIEQLLPDLRATITTAALAVPTTVQQTVSPIGQRFNTAAAGAPAVYVSIGNEAVDQYVTTRVDRQLERESRVMSQGVRR